MVGDSLIGAGDAARLFGVSRNTLLRRVENGEVPSIGRLPGPNGAVVLSRQVVEALVAAQARPQRPRARPTPPPTPEPDPELDLQFEPTP